MIHPAKKVLSIILLLATFSVVSTISIFLTPPSVYAQVELATEERLETKVNNIIEEKQIDIPDPAELGKTQKQSYQKLELLVTKGSLTGQRIIVENGNLPMANIQRFKTGDQLVINKTKDLDGNDLFYITDQVRRGSLFWLFAIFAVLTVIVGRWRGIASLIGMGVSFLVILVFILPRILAGSDPILTTILGSIAIIPVTFYLSHGINKKTTLAVVGTFVALVITGILANIFIEAAKLTGFVSEEAGFLQVAKQGAVNIKGLLLAGIIIGVLGVLDDVTVSQSAIVQQLKEANSKLKAGELYKRAMDVGRDHIASMVNTLVLVYAGASLPLLLLFINTPHPFSEVINYEIIANEVVRTLVGSIGLVLAVPITTLIAVAAFNKPAKVNDKPISA